MCTIFPITHAGRSIILKRLIAVQKNAGEAYRHANGRTLIQRRASSLSTHPKLAALKLCLAGSEQASGAVES
jgi:hypothetical protein